MSGMGGEIDSTTEDIQHAAIHRLPHFFAQFIIENFRIFVAQINDTTDSQTS